VEVGVDSGMRLGGWPGFGLGWRERRGREVWGGQRASGAERPRRRDVEDVTCVAGGGNVG
jgi:hypothetical protein